MKHGPKKSEYPMAIAPVGVETSALDGPVIDIRGIVSTLWRGKWIIAICTLIAAAIAYVAVSQFQPQYWAAGKVMFGEQRSNAIDLQGLFPEVEFDSEALQNELEVLRSITLAERVISELELEKNPHFNPFLQESGPSLMDYVVSLVPIDLKAWGLASDPPVIPDEERARIEHLALINQLQSNLSLQPVGRSRVIQVAFVSTDPKLSADVVNMVMDQYIFDQLEAKLATARDATEWLSARVLELRERLTESENVVEDTRERLSLSSGQGVDVTRQQIQGVTNQLTESRKRASSLEAQFNRIVVAKEEGTDLGAVPEFRASRILETYREEENALVAQRKSLARNLTDEHPMLQRIDAQLREVQSKKERETDGIVESIRIALDAAKTEQSSLEIELRELEGLSLRQSRDLLELRQLEREAEANRLLYETYLNRQRELTAQEDSQTTNVRVLSQAFKPVFPAGQKQNLILLVSAILGAMLGAGIVLLLDFLNNTYRASGQLESQTRLPVLGTIPATGGRGGTVDVMRRFLKRQNSSLAEAVRNLRTSVLFSNVDTPPKVVMITSSTPREGKSTTSLLMAMTSAQMGKKTILVDCDLRRPTMARTFDMHKDQSPGFFSIIQGTAVLEDAIYTDQATGLDILMNKEHERPEKVNAADILASKRFHDLIKVLTREYDMVVLDTPPALVVTDARVVSAVADSVIYVVRWGKTPRGAVADGLNELERVEAPVVGTVLTMINEAKAAKYVYEGQEYYRGKHREYYIE